jgi:hypothetical protein
VRAAVVGSNGGADGGAAVDSSNSATEKEKGRVRNTVCDPYNTRVSVNRGLQVAAMTVLSSI